MRLNRGRVFLFAVMLASCTKAYTARSLIGGKACNSDSDCAPNACDPNTKTCTTDGALDPDKDGHITSLDNCPNNSNENQEDTDGDAHGDACDLCPYAHNDGGACENDTDNDLIPAAYFSCTGIDCPSTCDANGDCAADNCPDDANQDQADIDKDGIGDACDNCVSISNTTGNSDEDEWCGEADLCQSVANYPPTPMPGDAEKAIYVACSTTGPVTGSQEHPFTDLTSLQAALDANKGVSSPKTVIFMASCEVPLVGTLHLFAGSHIEKIIGGWNADFSRRDMTKPTKIINPDNTYGSDSAVLTIHQTNQALLIEGLDIQQARAKPSSVGIAILENTQSVSLISNTITTVAGKEGSGGTQGSEGLPGCAADGKTKGWAACLQPNKASTTTASCRGMSELDQAIYSWGGNCKNEPYQYLFDDVNTDFNPERLDRYFNDYINSSYGTSGDASWAWKSPMMDNFDNYCVEFGKNVTDGAVMAGHGGISTVANDADQLSTSGGNGETIDGKTPQGGQSSQLRRKTGQCAAFDAKLLCVPAPFILIQRMVYLEGASGQNGVNAPKAPENENTSLSLSISSLNPTALLAWRSNSGADGRNGDPGGAGGGGASVLSQSGIPGATGGGGGGGGKGGEGGGHSIAVLVYQGNANVSAHCNSITTGAGGNGGNGGKGGAPGPGVSSVAGSFEIAGTSWKGDQPITQTTRTWQDVFTVSLPTTDDDRRLYFVRDEDMPPDKRFFGTCSKAGLSWDKEICSPGVACRDILGVKVGGGGGSGSGAPGNGGNGGNGGMSSCVTYISAAAFSAPSLPTDNTCTFSSAGTPGAGGAGTNMPWGNTLWGQSTFSSHAGKAGQSVAGPVCVCAIGAACTCSQ